MVHQAPDKGALRAEYESLRNDYERLEDALKGDLKMCLEQAGIRVLSIESRVKEFESFWGKAERERCANPLEDIRDICGLRVICYYPSDTDPVCDVIKHDFEVVEFEDKADSLKTQEFGYRSRHIIIAPAKHSLMTPRYRALDGLKAEIQVRTIFAHAWAELSHELDYKKEEHVPKPFRRTLHQLGAMLENLDDQFDVLHQEKGEYSRIVSEKAKRSGVFDADQELNVDTLQALLDFHLPDRERRGTGTRYLLDELVKSQITMRDFLDRYERVKPALAWIEQEMRQATEGEPEPVRFTGLSQVALARVVLLLTDDEYWQRVKRTVDDDMSRLMERWRSLSSMQH